MSTPSFLLPDLIAQHHGALLSAWMDLLGDGQDDVGLSGNEAQLEMAELLAALRPALSDGPAQALALKALEQQLAQASQARAERGGTPEAAVRFVHAGRDTLLNLLRHHGPADAALQVAAQAALQTVFDRCVTTLVSHFVAARESVIHGQAQSLLDMSTPVITLWESILLLPLVGVVDSVRAVQIAERLLETIGRTEAEVTLIDVTGVPVMDTSVARHLLRTVAAAEMLGTKVILTGISPTTAQTMVKLGIDLSAVPTRGSLKAGVALALRMTGRALPASGQPG